MSKPDQANEKDGGYKAPEAQQVDGKLVTPGGFIITGAQIRRRKGGTGYYDTAALVVPAEMMPGTVYDDLCGGKIVKLDPMSLPDKWRNSGSKTLRANQPLTAPNVSCVLETLGIVPAFNAQSWAVELLYSDKREWAVGPAQVLRDYLTRLGISYRDNALDAILAELAQRHRYHPMEQWLQSLQWDGRDHIADLAGTITTESNMWPVYLRRWLVQAVQAVCGWHDPKPAQLSAVLVFTGAQGVGKSTWFKNLVPPEFFRGDAQLHLNTYSSKDDQLAALKKPVVELGEIDSTFSRSDIGALKQFLARDVDELRVPYGREAWAAPRRTVFCGSVNRLAFLLDQTGSRRFWPVEVDRIEWGHSVNIEGVWAQAYQLWCEGESYTLDADEDRGRLEEAELYTHESTRQEHIRAFFAGRMDTPKADWQAVQLREAIGVIWPQEESTRVPRDAQVEIAETFTKLFGERRRQVNGVRRAWLMPLTTSELAAVKWP